MNGPCLSVHPYSFECLCALIAKLTDAAGDGISGRERFVAGQPHLGYLKEYFSHFSAGSPSMTILAECDYIDRDFWLS